MEILPLPSPRDLLSLVKYCAELEIHGLMMMKKKKNENINVSVAINSLEETVVRMDDFDRRVWLIEGG